MKLFVIVAISLLVIAGKVKTQNFRYSSINVSGIFNQLMQGYDSRIRPNFGGSPVVVNVSMYVLSMDVKYEKQEMSLDIYFRQKWNDERLAFKNSQGMESLPVPTESMHQFWIPDTFITNEKVASFHHVTKTNAFLRVHPNGDILTSTRLSVTLNCPMNFANFPFDSQVCKMDLESYGLSSKDIIYKWMEPVETAVQIADDLQPGQFRFLSHKQSREEVKYKHANYSKLRVELLVQRNGAIYVCRYYVPAFIVVVVSWLSLWLGSGYSTARIVVGLVSFVTMNMLMCASFIKDARFSYATSLDVYLVLCLLFVVAVLVQFVAASKFKGGKKTPTDEEGKSEKKSSGEEPKSKIDPSVVDKMSRIAVPILFLGYNVLYWSIYLSRAQLAVENF